MKPNITIIVTCFNTEKYLAECLDSIINQTYEAWEVLLVDDASVDQSLLIAKKYADSDKRIKIVENPVNIGHYASLNKALSMTHTEFFSRVDADDTVDIDYLSTCLEIINGIPNIGAVFVNFNYFDENKNSSSDYPDLVSDKAFGINQLLPDGQLKIDKYYFSPWLSDHFRGIGLIRTKLAIKLGGFEEWNSEADMLLYLKMVSITEVYCLNTRLYNYRKHQESATSKVASSGTDLKWKKKLLIEANETLHENEILTLQAYKKQKKLIIHEYHRHMINRARKRPNTVQVLVHMTQLFINIFS